MISNNCLYVVSRAFMVGAASQAGDADSSRAPGLTSGLQGSVNVQRSALLLLPQWQCIRSFVFNIENCISKHKNEIKAMVPQIVYRDVLRFGKCAEDDRCFRCFNLQYAAEWCFNQLINPSYQHPLYWSLWLDYKAAQLDVCASFLVR